MGENPEKKKKERKVGSKGKNVPLAKGIVE